MMDKDRLTGCLLNLALWLAIAVIVVGVYRYMGWL